MSSRMTTSHMFQSTRPRGARHKSKTDMYRSLAVSIHAPARGATGRLERMPPSSYRFNPRAREGRDSNPPI